jgi:RNA polymerase sigma-70 factor (ECF subfamily)
MPDVAVPRDQGDAPPDEAALIARAGREPEAFALLYDRYLPLVFAFAFRNVRDRAQAEDLTSQTFLQALRALPRYEQRGIPFRSWLLRITANLIVDARRRTVPTLSLQAGLRGQGEGGDDLPAYDPPDPHALEATTSWEGIADFMGLIADLTPDQQEVLRLRFVDGLAIAEIAGRLSRSQGSVKMLLLRGLQHLRRSIGPDYFSSNAIRHSGEMD